MYTAFMNKADLEAKLKILSQKSEQAIKQMNAYTDAAQAQKEEALMIKGEYRAIEGLIAELPDVKPDTIIMNGEEMDVFPTAKVSKKGKSDAPSSKK